MPQNHSFLEGRLYPILFMLALTVVFVGILAGYYRSSEGRIETNRQETFQLQILSLFADTLSQRTGLPLARISDPKNLSDYYSLYIHKAAANLAAGSSISSDYYLCLAGKDTLGYAYNLTGSGLWGTMRGLLAVTPDLSRIINFTIYEQMETPGLGARVEENWFRSQFTHQPLLLHDSIPQFTLIPENAEPARLKIRQITGASITSGSVLTMLRQAAGELAILHKDNLR